MDGWYGAIAKWNPLTWVIDWTRAITVEGGSWSNLVKAVGVVSLIATAGISMATRQLKKRIAALS